MHLSSIYDVVILCNAIYERMVKKGAFVTFSRVSLDRKFNLLKKILLIYSQASKRNVLHHRFFKFLQKLLGVDYLKFVTTYFSWMTKYLFRQQLFVLFWECIHFVDVTVVCFVCSCILLWHEGRHEYVTVVLFYFLQMCVGQISMKNIRWPFFLSLAHVWRGGLQCGGSSDRYCIGAMFHPKFISLAQVVPGPIQPWQCKKSGPKHPSILPLEGTSNETSWC